MKTLKPSSLPGKGETTVSVFSFFQSGQEGLLLIQHMLFHGLHRSPRILCFQGKINLFVGVEGFFGCPGDAIDLV
jgi:hypothetical protein